MNNPIRYWDPSGHIVTEWDKEHGISDKIDKATKAWNAAHSKGDKAGMTAAHAAAEAARNAVRSQNEIGTDSGYTYVMESSNKASLNSYDASVLAYSLSGSSSSSSSYKPSFSTTVSKILSKSGLSSTFNSASGQVVYANGSTQYITSPTPVYRIDTTSGQGTGSNNIIIKNEACYNIDEPWKNSMSEKYGVSDFDAAMLRSIYGVGNDNNFADGLYQALPRNVKAKIDIWSENNKELKHINPDLYNSKFADEVLNFYDATKDYIDVLNAIDNAVDSNNYLAIGALLFVGDGINNRSNIELSDGMTLRTNIALDEANDYLGKDYKDMGGGVYVSADEKRRVRLTDNDIASPNSHAKGPHMNFEVVEKVTKRNGKTTYRVSKNMHIFLSDK